MSHNHTAATPAHPHDLILTRVMDAPAAKLARVFGAYAKSEEAA